MRGRTKVHTGVPMPQKVKDENDFPGNSAFSWPFWDGENVTLFNGYVTSNVWGWKGHELNHLVTVAFFSSKKTNSKQALFHLDIYIYIFLRWMCRFWSSRISNVTPFFWLWPFDITVWEVLDAQKSRVSGNLSLDLFLFGGFFPTPFQKYAPQKWKSFFLNFRGESSKKSLKLPPPRFSMGTPLKTD